MTKKRLGKLKKLIKEAEHLESELRDVQFSPGEWMGDTAKDYSTGYPHNIKIEGYGDDKYAEIKERLAYKLARIQKERLFLENWLEQVSDPEMRDILRLQYINGMTQEEIADELGYVRETVSRKLKKFWENE